MSSGPDSLELLQSALRDHGITDELVRRVESAVVARRDQRGFHTDWGLLCEQCGLWALAFREFQLAVRDDPHDQIALERLAHYYYERGDAARAGEMLQRLTHLQPTCFKWWYQHLELLIEQEAWEQAATWVDAARAGGLSADDCHRLRELLEQYRKSTRDDEAGVVPAEGEPVICPTDADCVRFCTLFAGREDVYARQWARATETGYTPIHQPLTPAVIRNHLLGSITVGVYPLRMDGTATFFAVDLDIDRAALQRARGDHSYAQWLRDTIRREGLQVAHALRDWKLPVVFENSGYKGRHYWVFLEEPQTAATLQVLGKCLLMRLQSLLSPGFHLEFFPKQAERKGKGLGNLIKLPLGIHRRTGRRSLLLDEQGQVIRDPLAYLRTVRRCPTQLLYELIERWKAEAGADLPAEPAPADTTSREPLRQTHQEPPLPTAPPLPPPPPWTEADFEVDPRMRHILHHCPVLAELKRRAEEQRHLTYDEQLVLMHTLGHLESGPPAVNYLLQKCVDVGPDKLMKSRYRGNPMSCATIRKKIPYITSRVPCNCDFSFAPDRYPHPGVHLLTLSETPPATPPPGEPEPLDRLAVRLAHLEQRRRQVEQECQELRQVLVERLRRTPERIVLIGSGCYRLLEKDGVEELVWEHTQKTNGHPPADPVTGDAVPENIAASHDDSPPFGVPVDSTAVG